VTNKGKEQGRLFDVDGRPAAPQHQPNYVYGGEPPSVPVDTSEQAAHSMVKVTGTLRIAVYQYIKGQGTRGATDNEVERVLDMRHQTASARRRELYLGGWVKDSGARRPTDSGRPAIVWVAGPRKNGE